MSLDGQVCLACCKQITSICFFLNKETNKKILFAQWANGKRIKENRLGFQFLFDISVSMCSCVHVSIFPCFHVSISLSPCLHISANEKWQLPLLSANGKREMANFSLVAANGNGKLTFVFLGRQTINGNQWVNTEVSNNTSKCNGNTHYPLCRILTAITFSSDNVS